MLSILAVAAGLLLAAPGLAADAKSAEPKVVFVCEHGAAKSVIAAAHFNQLAKERGLSVRAISRGTNPDPVVAPKVAAGLRTEGLTDITAKPELLTDKDVSSAKRVVTLGCKLPQKARVTDWNDIPSVSEDYNAASRAIKKHVEVLLLEMK